MKLQLFTIQGIPMYNNNNRQLVRYTRGTYSTISWQNSCPNMIEQNIAAKHI